MSYLDVPRIHFGGLFFTDPSTINNFDGSFDPKTVLLDQNGQYMSEGDQNSGGPSGWNPTGKAHFWLEECTVLSAVGESGEVQHDPVLGATVETPSPSTPKKAPKKPDSNHDIAKLVDLDVDQQHRSAVYGFRIYLGLPGGGGFSGKLTVPELRYLWGDRFCSDSKFDGAMMRYGGTMMGVISKPEWDKSGSSPFLTTFKNKCELGIAIKLTMDLHQSFYWRQENGDRFGYGRVMGTMGPFREGELEQVPPARQLVDQIPSGSGPNLSGAYALVREGGRTLTIDLGATLPLRGRSGKFENFEDTKIDAKPFSVGYIKPGDDNGTDDNGTDDKETFDGKRVWLRQATNLLFSESQYRRHNSIKKKCSLLMNCGIFDIDLTQEEKDAITDRRLVVGVGQEDSGKDSGYHEIAEHKSGIFADLSLSSLRVSQKDSRDILLMVREYGRPLATMSPQIEICTRASGSSTMENGKSGNIPIKVSIGNTNVHGIAQLTIETRFDSLELPSARLPMDSSLYYISFKNKIDDSWIGDYHQVSGNANLSVLVWKDFTPPQNPTWDDDIEPILGAYARLYPGMKDLLDIGDETTVRAFARGLKARMSLDFSHPAYMPVTRDLSPRKEKMIVDWLDSVLKETEQGHG